MTAGPVSRFPLRVDGNQCQCRLARVHNHLVVDEQDRVEPHGLEVLITVLLHHAETHISLPCREGWFVVLVISSGHVGDFKALVEILHGLDVGLGVCRLGCIVANDVIAKKEGSLHEPVLCNAIKRRGCARNIDDAHDRLLEHLSRIVPLALEEILYVEPSVSKLSKFSVLGVSSSQGVHRSKALW